MQPHRLLLCPLDAPLQQILNLLGEFNHIWQKGRDLKDKSFRECQANQRVGWGGETTAVSPVWEEIAMRAEQPQGVWVVNVQQTSEPTMAPSAFCPQERWGTGGGSQGMCVDSKVL